MVKKMQVVRRKNKRGAGGDQRGGGNQGGGNQGGGDALTKPQKQSQPYTHPPVINDMYLAAFLSYNGGEYKIKVKKGRARFEFKKEGNTDNLIAQYYSGVVNNVNAMRFVEEVKKVKIQMYEAKEKRGGG